MIDTVRPWQGLAGLNGLVALVMGAIGAHGVQDLYLSMLVERASLYQLLHAVLLFVLADKSGRAACVSRCALQLGIVLFCGSLYLKALLGTPTILAPAGGLSLMLGWLAVAFIR